MLQHVLPRGNAPSNTIKIALCAMSGVGVITLGIFYLSMQQGENVGLAIEVLGDLGVGLTNLGAIAAVAKGGRDAAKDLAAGMQNRVRRRPRISANAEVEEQVDVASPDDDVTAPKVRKPRKSDEVPLPDEDE